MSWEEENEKVSVIDKEMAWVTYLVMHSYLLADCRQLERLMAVANGFGTDSVSFFCVSGASSSSSSVFSSRSIQTFGLKRNCINHYRRIEYLVHLFWNAREICFIYYRFFFINERIKNKSFNFKAANYCINDEFAVSLKEL